jgi:hypothetical protein
VPHCPAHIHGCISHALSLGASSSSPQPPPRTHARTPTHNHRTWAALPPPPLPTTHPSAMPRPPRNIAALPAQLLPLLKGSLALPSRRPTMSASPSPPHIMETATRPAGLPLQKARVQVMSTCAASSSGRPPQPARLTPRAARRSASAAHLAASWGRRARAASAPHVLTASAAERCCSGRAPRSSRGWAGWRGGRGTVRWRRAACRRGRLAAGGAPRSSRGGP